MLAQYDSGIEGEAETVILQKSTARAITAQRGAQVAIELMSADLEEDGVRLDVGVVNNVDNPRHSLKTRLIMLGDYSLLP